MAFYACRLGVPRRALGSAATLGGVAVVVARGLTPLSADLSRPARTLLAALVIGVAGRLLANRSQAPAALWMVPAILPLLPAPSTLLPALAETEPARQALQGLAAETAFLIGVGVASGSILVETYHHYRARVLEPVVGVISDRLSSRVLRPIRAWARRRGVEPTMSPMAATPSMDALRVDPEPTETAMVRAVAGQDRPGDDWRLKRRAV